MGGKPQKKERRGMRIITLFLALLFVVSCAFLGGNSINPQGTEFFVYQAHSALGVSGLAYGTYLKIAPWMNQVVSILLVATVCSSISRNNKKQRKELVKEFGEKIAELQGRKQPQEQKKPKTIQCVHGQCDHCAVCNGHEPKWEKVGESRLEPDPRTLKPRWLTRSHCCRAPVIKTKEVWTEQCGKCERTRDRGKKVAICLHCGESEPHRKQFRKESETPTSVADDVQSQTPILADANPMIKSETPTPVDNVQSQLVSWQNFYHKLGITVDISKLKIPASQPGFTRLILVPEGMTSNKAIALLKKKMSVWQYAEDLDTIASVRDANGAYVIRVRDRQEADEELKNLSADDLKKYGVNCITLVERLLYEMKFFAETGKHLDEKSWTLCSGSRDSGGGVPSVRWLPNYGRVAVFWDYADNRAGGFRGRVAVS